MVAQMWEAGGDWWLTSPGDYDTGAAEAWQRDGSGYQRVVLLRWPARQNKGTKQTVLQLMLAPEDAEGLAKVLEHTARWLRSAEVLGPRTQGGGKHG